MQSADPVVRDFFPCPQICDLSGPWRPGSIRDQAIRACLVVERALRYGWISTERDLAIAGAGVAGIAAALLAHDSGVSVTIFEKDKPAAFLSESPRWVDPTLYDWPHSWWGAGHFPWTAGPLPIRWIEAAPAQQIAARLGRLLKQRTGIRYIRREVTGLSQSGDCAQIEAADGVAGVYGLVIDCRGLGSECCRSGEFEGAPFWAPVDYLQEVAEIARQRARPCRVLISGGGDGAIQDFLIIATGQRRVAEIAQSLGLARSVLIHGQPPMPASSFDRFEKEALSVEEQHWRKLCWTSANGSRDLDDFYKGWIDRIPLKALPENPHAPQITLVRQSECHSTCYPLNRFLAMAAERQFAGTNAEGNRVRVDIRIGALESLGLSRSGFDLAIIRHGIDAACCTEVPRLQSLPFAF